MITRTALVASRAFLLYDGYQINATMQDRLETFLALADGSLPEDALADWFSKWMIKA